MYVGYMQIRPHSQAPCLSTLLRYQPQETGKQSSYLCSYLGWVVHVMLLPPTLDYTILGGYTEEEEEHFLHVHLGLVSPAPSVSGGAGSLPL